MVLIDRHPVDKAELTEPFQDQVNPGGRDGDDDPASRPEHAETLACEGLLVFDVLQGGEHHNGVE